MILAAVERLGWQGDWLRVTGIIWTRDDKYLNQGNSLWWIERGTSVIWDSVAQYWSHLAPCGYWALETWLFQNELCCKIPDFKELVSQYNFCILIQVEAIFCIHWVQYNILLQLIFQFLFTILKMWLVENFKLHI